MMNIQNSSRSVGYMHRWRHALPSPGFVQRGSDSKRVGLVRGPVVVSAGDGQDLDELLKEDMQRMAAKQSNSVQVEERNDSEGSSLKDIVDKILIADFFFVLFSLGWFGVGVGVKSSSGDSGILDAWISLWQWVFQPAIGVLMLGALVSGTIGWIKKKME